MKRIFGVLILLVVGVVLLGSARAEDRGIPGEELLRTLAQAHPDMVFGWEQIPWREDAVPGSERFFPTAIDLRPNVMSLAKIAELIGSQTKYQCLVGTDYFVIAPKAGREPAEVPSSLRKVRFPDADGAEGAQFFRQVSGVEPSAPLAVVAGWQNYPHRVEGKLTIQAGEDRCYALMNRLAQKSGARFWLMLHLNFYKPGATLPLPVNWGASSVLFLSGL